MKKYRLLLVMLLTAGMTSVSVHASEQARILWADKRGIETWKVVDNHTLHIQDRQGKWFEAELYHDVPSLEFAISLGFVTGPLGELDKFSSIYHAGSTYRFRTFTELEVYPYTEDTDEKANV